MVNRRSSTIRKVHRMLGVISALNLLLLIATGLLLQHMNGLRLDEHMVSRRFLPANYRPQDGSEGVRADIVITDLHSGRIVGRAGTAILDVITLGWLVLLLTGLVMYTARANGVRNGRKDPSNGGDKRAVEAAFGEAASNEGNHDSTHARNGSSGRVEPRIAAGMLRCCPALCPLAAENVAVMHLTDPELKRALQALGHLWTKPTGTATLRKTTLIVCAYRCRDGHCHLLCQSPADLCRTEQSALVLLEVMAEAATKQGSQFMLPVDRETESRFGQIV